MGTLIAMDSMSCYNSVYDQGLILGEWSSTYVNQGSIGSGVFPGTKTIQNCTFNRVLTNPLTYFYIEWRGCPVGYVSNCSLAINSSLDPNPNTRKLLLLVDTQRNGVNIYNGTQLNLLWASPNNILSAQETGWYGFGGVIDGTAGQIWFNYGGVNLWHGTGLNTLGDSTATSMDTIWWGFGFPTWSSVTDILVCSDSFCGDTLTMGVVPTANGTVNNFTPDPSGPNVNNVDSATLQTANYNYSSTAGNKERYKFGSPPSGTIIGVELGAYVWQDTGGGTRQVCLAVDNGTNQYPGPNIALPSNSPMVYRKMYTQNPTTSSAWAQADFTASTGYTEFGLNLVI